MSPQARPEAVAFDPGSGEIPPTLGPVLTDPEIPILLLVAAEADDLAARTVIGLAEARAKRGRATVLADASFAPPRLHHILDVPNLEGLADLFLFGASVGHVATRPANHAFEFIPAGAYVPDPQAVLRSPRWERVSEEFKASRSQLMLFVPASSGGIGELSRRVGRAVVLAPTREVDRVLSRLDPSCTVDAVLTPRSAAVPERPVAEPTDPVEVAAGPGGVGGVGSEEAPLSEPLVIRKQTTRRRTSPVLIGALLVAAAAGGWFAYGEYLAPEARTAPATTVAAGGQSGPDRGEPVETPVPISVAVELHAYLGSARERLAALRSAEPRIGFYLSPLVSNGDLYYRVLAGPVVDREAGVALMQRLVASGQKSAADAWAVLPTELAFQLGEFDTRAEAAARVESLSDDDIPAYIVPIRYDPGEPRYRVYGGAYENESEAEVMREMLENAGIEARLVRRTGEPVG